MSTLNQKETTMTSNASIAEIFYKEMSAKNIPALEHYIHPDVQFITPMAKLQGKKAYLDAVKTFSAFFQSLTIRATFGDDHQAVVVYDTNFPAPIGKLPGVSLMDFTDGLITRIELFHDTSPFNMIKNEFLA
jgi:hypothetical protein